MTPFNFLRVKGLYHKRAVHKTKTMGINLKSPAITTLATIIVHQ